MENHPQNTMFPIGDSIETITNLIRELDSKNADKNVDIFEFVKANTELITDWMRHFEVLRTRIETDFYTATHDTIIELGQLLDDLINITVDTVRIIQESHTNEKHLQALSDKLVELDVVHEANTAALGSVLVAEDINRNLRDLIAPHSLYLGNTHTDEAYDYHVWLVVEASTDEELITAGRMAAYFKKRYSDYKGLSKWLAERISKYPEDEIRLLQEKYENPSTEILEKLDAVQARITRLDNANTLSEHAVGPILEEATVTGSYTEAQVDAIQYIGATALELKEYLEGNWSFFFHVRTPGGEDLLTLLDTAIVKGACNNALCRTMRKSLSATYMEVPSFVKVYNHLDKSGYFAHSGDSH